MKGRRPRGGSRLLRSMVAISAIAALPVAVASASVWNKGDVFAGVNSTGTTPAGYQVFDNAGTPKEFVGKASSTGFATGCGFDQSRNLYGTFFGDANVIEFANAHPHPDLKTIDVGATGAADTESMVFDAAGNFYVGNADGDRDVVKYDAAGNLVDQFDVETGPRGTDWVELAADQKTLFYTSEGSDIRRYDVATHTQLPPFATGLPERALRPAVACRRETAAAACWSRQRTRFSGSMPVARWCRPTTPPVLASGLRSTWIQTGPRSGPLI